MGLTPQKQYAVDELVRKAIGPTRAVVKMIGRRQHSKKWSNYQQFLTDDGFTAFVNLDADPMTVKVSDKPNAMHFGRYKRAHERAEKLLEKKAAKETKAAVEPKKSKVAKRAKKPAVPLIPFENDIPTLEGTADCRVKK